MVQVMKRVCLVMVEEFLVVEPVETTDLYSQCGNHGKGAFDRLRHHDRLSHREKINQEGLFVMVAVFLVVEPVETTDVLSITKPW